MLNRIIRYVLVFLFIMFVFSCFSIFEHREVLSQYFLTGIGSAGGILLYVLIYAFGFGLLLRAIF